MAKKNFVELNEAAKTLGLTPDQLLEMRSAGEIHGYRDGKSWKFKVAEVERIAGELQSKAASSDQSDEADEASVLVSEEELGESGATTSSTIIGKGEGAAEAESDLKLAPSGEADSPVAAARPAGPRLQPGPGSDVALVSGIGTESDVSLVPDPGSDLELGGGADPGLAVQSGSTGGTGRLAAGSDMSIGSSDLDLAIDSGLALSDDDEVVLGGSGLGSDLSLGTADSGINLASPSDSGLSLEADSGINLQSPTDSGLSLEDDAVDSSGSSISSLELPEDEQAVTVEKKPTAAVKKDEEFSLEPSQDMFSDESDSGSQVIALEESGAFDQADALVQTGGPGLLEETNGLDAKLEGLGAAAGTTTGRMLGMPYGSVDFPEAPYSIWNVVGLLMILMFLSLSGILLTDIVQNMWAWEEARDVSTGISDALASMIFGR